VWFAPPKEVKEGNCKVSDVWRLRGVVQRHETFDKEKQTRIYKVENTERVHGG